MSKIKVEIKSYLKDIVPDFIQNKKNDLGLIEDAIKNRDYETIRRLGHNMAGTGTSYGLPAVTDWGKKIEHFAENENEQECLANTKECLEYFDNLEISFVD